MNARIFIPAPQRVAGQRVDLVDAVDELGPAFAQRALGSLRDDFTVGPGQGGVLPPVGFADALGVGASSGCLGVLFLLNLTDGPSAVLSIATRSPQSVRCSSPGPASERRRRRGRCWNRAFKHRGAVLPVLAGSAMLNGMTYFGVQPLLVKGKLEHGNSTSLGSGTHSPGSP